MTKEQKAKVLSLLNEASEILENNIDDENEENQETILCPLGEVIDSVYDIEVG